MTKTVIQHANHVSVIYARPVTSTNQGVGVDMAFIMGNHPIATYDTTRDHFHNVYSLMNL